MNYSIVLDKILTLWRNCGATTGDETKRSQYLTKEQRPDNIMLTLEYGIPRQLRTPNEIYTILTVMDGKTRKFAEGLSYLFEYSVYSPEDITLTDASSLKNIVTVYNPLVLSIKKMK